MSVYIYQNIYTIEKYSIFGPQFHTLQAFICSLIPWTILSKLMNSMCMQHVYLVDSDRDRTDSFDEVFDLIYITSMSDHTYLNKK